MSIAERTAQAVWSGPLPSGTGQINVAKSPLDGAEVSWAARTGDVDGQTNPEQLLAAAHSSCFSMALALRLGERKVAPERLQVEATVTLDEVDGRPTITSSRLIIKARVPGLDNDAFQTAVAEAAELCPVSRLFAGARISVDALLEPR